MRMCDRGVQMLITTVGAFAAFSLMTIAVGTDYWLYSRGVCRTKSTGDNDTSRKNEEVMTHSGLWRTCCLEGTDRPPAAPPPPAARRGPAQPRSSGEGGGAPGPPAPGPAPPGGAPRAAGPCPRRRGTGGPGAAGGKLSRWLPHTQDAGCRGRRGAGLPAGSRGACPERRGAGAGAGARCRRGAPGAERPQVPLRAPGLALARVGRRAHPRSRSPARALQAPAAPSSPAAQPQRRASPSPRNSRAGQGVRLLPLHCFSLHPSGTAPHAQRGLPHGRAPACPPSQLRPAALPLLQQHPAGEAAAVVLQHRALLGGRLQPKVPG